MKRLLHFTTGCLLLLFAACDEVALEERFVQMEAITPRRAVLLEDFTGQWCSNCPDAHKIINELKEQYGEALFIAVAVHAGSDKNAILEGSIPGLVGLKQPEGDDYAARWGIEAYPSGVVNRRGGKSTYQDWPNLVREALLQESSLEMELTAAASHLGAYGKAVFRNDVCFGRRGNRLPRAVKAQKSLKQSGHQRFGRNTLSQLRI